MDGVIESAEEFVRLSTSEVPAEYHRAAHDSASVGTWVDAIERYPEMRQSVAHNKTVPLEILERLRHDPDEHVRWMVLQKRSWARAHPDDSERKGGLANTRAPAWKKLPRGSRET
jgi:Leucine rich repeat variant